jgi:hypothetical protein
MRGPALSADSSLDEMRRAYVDSIVFHCRRCSRRATIPVGDLIDRYGSRLRESEIMQRAYCSQCSARTFDMSPMASSFKRYLKHR